MRKQKEEPQTKPIIAGAVKILFEVIKHFLRDFDTTRTAKKFEKYGEQFQTLESLLLKMDNRIKEYRREIEELKNRLLWNNIFLIAILILLVVLIAVR